MRVFIFCLVVVTFIVAIVLMCDDKRSTSVTDYAEQHLALETD